MHKYTVKRFMGGWRVIEVARPQFVSMRAFLTEKEAQAAADAMNEPPTFSDSELFNKELS